MAPTDRAPRPRPVPAASKGRRQENFPVASILIKASLRPHVHAFYDFARAADDIADDPDLAAADKIRRLDAFARALDGGKPEPAAPGDRDIDTGPAKALAGSLAETGVAPRHATDLLAAFRQDATKHRYADWHEVMAYCRLSAAPCGRYLLALHGEEDVEARKAADALSAALQVINHIQDMAADYRRLDRVYVPMDWLADEALDPDALGADAASPALRRVIDRMLDGVEGLIDDARGLPAAIDDARLAAEAGVILAVARGLARKLRRRDPLAQRVSLNPLEFAAVAVIGVMCTVAQRLGR